MRRTRGRHSHPKESKGRLARALQLIAVGAIVSLLSAGVASADNVINDVLAGGNDTITAGGSTTINYKVNPAAAGDPQSGCNASDGTPVTITLSVPAAVSASTTSFQLSDCTPESFPITFSSNTAGNYPINVASTSDAGGGTYNNQANWTLKVNAAAPSDTTPPSWS